MVGDIDWKLIETPVGRGTLFRKTGRQVAQVAYRLEHFAAIQATRSGTRVDLKRVVGRVDVAEIDDYAGTQYVLHLKDGRHLDLRIVDHDGEIEDWSGKGLYRPKLT